MLVLCWVREPAHGYARIYLLKSQQMPANVDREHTNAEPHALDETTFQQLLEAAYVIQQHNETPAQTPTYPDASEILAKVVATHEILQSSEFDLASTMSLIAERLQDATRARGVAIGVKQQDHLQYCASVGTGVSSAGSSVPIDLGSPELSHDSSLPDENLSFGNGQIPPVTEIDSLLVVPLHYDGRVAGVLEVRFHDNWNHYDPDIEACELMSGLATEAIARAVGREWKQALASERATMMQSLERIRPQLERLASNSAPVEELAASPASELALPSAPAASASCVRCGYVFTADEQFCGNCGMSRSGADFAPLEAGSPILQESESSFGNQEESPYLTNQAAAYLTPVFHGDPALVPSAPSGPVRAEISAAAARSTPPEPAPETKSGPWSSAHSTHRWLESLQKNAGRTWLARNRANVYLAAAILILLLVLSGWGTHHVSYSSARSPQPELSLFDRLLVSLGLAEVPSSAPAHPGNPTTQVWEDVHTALYYCPGTDLYGKTQGGKYTTQKDAQQDQFQPADGVSCE